jgi:hypothetical protein
LTIVLGAAGRCQLDYVASSKGQRPNLDRAVVLGDRQALANPPLGKKSSTRHRQWG